MSRTGRAIFCATGRVSPGEPKSKPGKSTGTRPARDCTQSWPGGSRARARAGVFAERLDTSAPTDVPCHSFVDTRKSVRPLALPGTGDHKGEPTNVAITAQDS